MKKGIKLIIITSVILNLILCYFLFFSKDKTDKTPPFHPFKLNSNLNLESIVENGYKFSSMPCGQVQYTKQIADTIIQYEVGIDCNEYKGNYKIEMSDIYEEVELSDSTTIVTSTKKIPTREEMISENKYYPWEINEIKNCYQKINWRVFTINLGAKIDSSSIEDFIYKKGGNIKELPKKWNSRDGGNFISYHSESRLYFFCSLVNERNNDSEENNWQFRIIRDIPNLDQKSIIKEKEWKKKRNNYYEQ